MKARIKWGEDRTFVGESGTGHKIVLGTASDPEGRTPGPSPMELVLTGTRGCSAFDVVHILERGREPVEAASSNSTPSAQRTTRRFSPASTCASS